MVTPATDGKVYLFNERQRYINSITSRTLSLVFYIAMRPIRQRAHAATIFAIFWTIPSIGVFVGVIDSWRHNNREIMDFVLMAIIFVIYVATLFFTFHLWKTEVPKPSQNVEGFFIDDLLDMDPKEINLVNESRRIKRIFLFDIAFFLFMMFSLWRADKNGLVGGCILLGSILFLHLLIETIRYLILRNRFHKISE